MIANGGSDQNGSLQAKGASDIVAENFKQGDALVISSSENEGRNSGLSGLSLL